MIALGITLLSISNIIAWGVIIGQGIDLKKIREYLWEDE